MSRSSPRLRPISSASSAYRTASTRSPVNSAASGEVRQYFCCQGLVTEPAGHFEALFHHGPSGLRRSLGLPTTQRARQRGANAAKRFRPHLVRYGVGPGQGGADCVEAVRFVPRKEEKGQGSAHPQDFLGPARLGKEVVQCRPEVVPVKAELLQPTGLVRSQDHGLGALGELQVVLGVGRSRSFQGSFAAGRQQPLGTVLADRLQQRVAERA